TTTGTGSYTLSGGSLSVNGVDLTVGSYNPTNTREAGIGILTVNGSGVLTALNYIQTGDNPMSAVNLNGGTINCGFLNFGGGTSQFHWTTGVLNFTQSVSSDVLESGNVFGPSAVLTNGQTLMVTGESETLGGTKPFSLTLNAGSTNYVQGVLTLDP